MLGLRSMVQNLWRFCKMNIKIVTDITYLLNQKEGLIQNIFDKTEHRYMSNFDLGINYEFSSFDFYVSKDLVDRVHPCIDWDEELDSVFDNNLYDNEKYKGKLQLVATIMDNVAVIIMIDYGNSFLKIIENKVDLKC